MPGLFTNKLLETLSDAARRTPRLRMNHNIHPVPEDPVQRFFNAMQPGTYVRPHRHVNPPRWEFFLVLQGHMVILVFDDEGRVEQRHELTAGGPVFGVELEAGRWHALIALQPSAMFELKQGPYNAMSDKDFAAWAPAEDDAASGSLLEWYRNAQPGDRFHDS